MSKSRPAAFSRLTELLFGGPLSTNYLVLALVAIFTGGYLVYSVDTLPLWVKSLAMMATLLVLSRLFEPPWMRWAWLLLMLLLSLVPLLELLEQL